MIIIDRLTTCDDLAPLQPPPQPTNKPPCLYLSGEIFTLTYRPTFRAGQ